MAFIFSSLSLAILLTSLIIGTENVLYFSIFFPKQLNYPSNSS